MLDFRNKMPTRYLHLVAVLAVMLPGCALHAQSGKPLEGQLVTIVFPRKNKEVQRRAVDIVLEIESNVDRDSLSLSLNGKNITNRLRGLTGCRAGVRCIATATVSERTGLLAGSNHLQVEAAAWHDGNSDPEIFTRDFLWRCHDCQADGLGASETPMQLTPSVAFTTVSPGGQPAGDSWFDILSNATNGGNTVYPSSSDTACTTRYQVVVLDRKNLTETSYACYADDATLTSALKGSTLSGALVIVGTTKGQTAGPALDTSPIGGTQYTSSSYPAASYPQSYMAIGIGGANAGTIYESYSVSGTNNGGYLAQLSGTFAEDPYSRYNFYPDEHYIYSVDATNLKITVNGYTYTAPSGVNPGFWMLKLNRNTLANEHGCTLSSDGVTYAGCGLSFATQTDAGIGSLATALSAAAPQDLIFLVSAGVPVKGLATSNSANLATQFDNLGASGYSLEGLAKATAPTYTLITSTDAKFGKSSIGGNVVVSSNLFTNQQQTGSVAGVLARDLHSLFLPINTMQGTLTSTQNFDYSFYQLAWTQPNAWLSTAISIGAYKYLSYEVIRAADQLGEGDDLHALFNTSSANLVVNSRTYPSQVPYPSGCDPAACTWTDPVDGQDYTFNQTDMANVASMLDTELNELEVVSNYLTPLRGDIVGGANSGGVVLDLLGAASKMASSLSQGSNTTVSLNYSDIANYAGAICGLAAIGEPEEVGQFEKVLGYLSGTFWAAGSAGIVGIDSVNPPSPYATLAATVSELADTTTKYSNQIATGFDTIADNIYSDPTKLSKAAENMGVGGKWELKNQVVADAFAPLMQQAANTYFFTQIFGAVYSVDGYRQTSSDVTSALQIGSWANVGTGYCAQIYRNAASNSYIKETSIGPYNPSVNDLFILSGPITRQNSTRMSVNLPDQQVVDTLFGALASGDLNLNFDQFWAPNGPAKRRYWPNTPSYGSQSYVCKVQQ